MSNNQNKTFIALHGGETCKPVNPFDIFDSPKEYNRFAATNNEIPITEVMPEGETFEGSEVNQARGKKNKFSIEELIQANLDNWETINERQLKTIDHEYYETRIAIKPLKAIEPVKIYECMDCNTHSFKKQIGGCPACGSVHITVMPEHKKEASTPLVDVVENKEETVEQICDEYCTNMGYVQSRFVTEIFEYAFNAGAKQSQSIEGIVGFVLEAAKDRFINYQISISENLDIQAVNDLASSVFDSLESDIIKEYNNGK